MSREERRPPSTSRIAPKDAYAHTGMRDMNVIPAPRSHAQRVLIARTAFIDILMRDPRTVAVREGWEVVTGLGEAAREVARCLDDAARIMGVSTRDEVLDMGDGVHPTVPGVSQSEADGCVAAVNAATERFIQRRSSQKAIDASTGIVVGFVRAEIGLPWPWIAMEFLDRFIRGIQRIVIDVPASTTYEIPPPSAPAIRHVFETRAGETVEAARIRLRSEFAAVADILTASTDDEGRSPRNGTHIARNVEWFYRHLVKQPPDTQYRLAQEYWTAKGKPGKDNDSTVAAGIRMADELLSTCVLTWNDPESFKEGVSIDGAT